MQRVLVGEDDRGRVLVELPRREQPLELRDVVCPEAAEEDEQVAARDRVRGVELEVADLPNDVEDPVGAVERAVEQRARDGEPPGLGTCENSRFYAGCKTSTTRVSAVSR